MYSISLSIYICLYSSVLYIIITLYSYYLNFNGFLLFFQASNNFSISNFELFQPHNSSLQTQTPKRPTPPPRMRVIQARDAFISDYEAYQFLSTLQKKNLWDDESLKELAKINKTKKGKFQKRPYNHPVLQGIVNDTLSYLTISKTVAAEEGEEGESEEAKQERRAPITKMNDESFTELMNKLNQFDLYKIEKLQIVNQLPTNMVYLFAIVEECDSRFSEDQINEILKIISSYI